MYRIEVVHHGKDLSLSYVFFFFFKQKTAYEIKITRPGRDFRASPIDEVTVAVDAKDDFGLKEVSLHYSVNGGPEKTVAMHSGGKTSTGTTVIAMEDFKAVPGDIVSLYATAKDARK